MISDEFSHILVEEVGVIHGGGIGEFDELPLILVRFCETNNKTNILMQWENEHLQKCAVCIMKANEK